MLAGKLGKCIIGREGSAFAPQSLECFLESGMGLGLKFAIMFVSVTDIIPEQDRRERTAATTYPFGCSLTALILIRAGGNQSVLFHLTCGRIVNPSGPRTSAACAVLRQPKNLGLCATAGRAIRLKRVSELGQ